MPNRRIEDFLSLSLFATFLNNIVRGEERMVNLVIGLEDVCEIVGRMRYIEGESVAVLLMLETDDNNAFPLLWKAEV